MSGGAIVQFTTAARLSAVAISAVIPRLHDYSRSGGHRVFAVLAPIAGKQFVTYFAAIPTPSGRNRHEMSVGDFLLKRLAELGARYLFGVPGDYNLWFLEQVERSNQVEFIG